MTSAREWGRFKQDLLTSAPALLAVVFLGVGTIKGAGITELAMWGLFGIVAGFVIAVGSVLSLQ